MVLMRGLLPSAMRKITIKKYWYKFHSHKRLKRIPNLLAYFILCFIIIFFSNSNLIIYFMSSIKEDNNFNQGFKPKASDPPVISILSPDNYTLFGTNAPNYSLTIADGIGNYSWYEFLETGEKSVPKELEGTLNEEINDTFDQTLWDNLNNGTVTIRFYVNDSLGDVGQADAIIRIDIIVPTINVISPTGGFFNSTSPDFTVEISDPNFDKMWYTLNTDTTKYLFQDNGTIDQSAWNSLPDGPVDINFFANDSVANENSVSVQVTKDSVNPAPPISLSADPSSWTSINNFDLSWTNPTDTSGIVGAYYKLYTAPTSNTDGIYIAGSNIETLTGITVSSNGTHTIYVWLKDAAGNVNYNNYNMTLLYLDREDPNAPIDLAATPSSWTNIDSFDLTWTNPSDISGIVGAYYSLDSIPTSDTGGIYEAGADIQSISGISVATDGTHTIYVWLNDTAGNIDYNNYASTQLLLDTANPSSVVGLSVNVSSWTNIDSFNLSWTNPTDTSGIVGVYYSLDSAPISDTNGTYVAGDNIESIVVTAGIDGTHTAYVWLVDAAGNIDYNTYVSIQFYLDTSDPLAPSGLIAIPSSWTNINYFNVSWTNPSDMSGIIGVYYKLDSAPTSDIDGIYVEGSNIEILTGITVSSNGTHTIYVWLRDTAGNINYNNYNATLLYLDAIKPTIDDLQEGDDMWRNAGGTTYNVDFIDPNPSSTLDYAQYKITSATGQGGTILVDWTYIFTDHGASIYTLDWTIDFDACQEGTNWVSVRVFDDAGNFEVYNDTFYVKKDTLSPALLINSPQDGSKWNVQPDIHLSATDLNLDSVWYTVGGTKILLTNGVSEPLNYTIWSNLLGEQEFTIYFYANDTVGNVNNTYSHTLYKDVLAPRMTINKPSNLTYYDDRPLINITVIDPNFASLTYSVVGIESPKNIWYNNNTEVRLDQNIWNQLPQGEFKLTFSAFDDLGNGNEISLTLYKDTIAPSIIINSPDDLTYWNSAPYINVSAYDPNFQDVWYRVGTTNISLTNNLEEILDANIWDGLSEGAFYVQIFANDTFGHLNDTYTLLLYKDISAPQLTISSPTNQTYYASPPDIHVIATDLTLDKIWYKIGTTEIELPNNSPTPLNSSLWNSLAQGAFIIELFANDTLNQLNNSYSLMLYKDTLPPNIIINSPLNRTSWNTRPPINVSAIDPNLDDIWYRVGGYQDLLLNNTEELLDSNVWNSLGNGPFEMYIWAIDDFNHISNNYVLTLYKDTQPPQVIINTPVAGSVWNGPPTLNVMAIDLSLDTIWYQAGSENFTLTNNTDEMFDIDIWNSLPEGAFLIEFFANDTFGYLNDLVQITLFKDTTLPNVNPYLPNNNTYYSVAPDIQIYVNDVNFDSVWYTVGTDKGILEEGVSEPLDATIWNSLSQGEFIINIFANDTAGNVNNTYFFVLYKDTLPPNVYVTSPQNNSYWSSYPIIHVIAYDPNFDVIRYKLGVMTPQVIPNDTDYEVPWSIWLPIPDGPVLLEIFAEDIFGHINDSLKLIIYKDTAPPDITVYSPQHNTLFGAIAPNYDITITEGNLEQTWYQLIGLTFNSSFYFISVLSGVPFSGTVNQSAWDLFGDGTLTIRFSANDSLNNVNHFDRIVRKNTIDPIINIDPPHDYELFGQLSPNVTIYKSGIEIDTTWYTLNNLNFTFSELNIQLDQNAWNAIGNGTVLIKFYINDTAGNFGYDEVILRKDIIIPIVYINLPYNNTMCRRAPYINITAVDPNLDKIWYRINGESRYLLNSISQALESTIWANLPEGLFTIEIFANDTVGNLNDLYKLYLEKDSILPNITIISPSENQNVERDSPFFEISVFDIHLDSTWYIIEEINEKVLFTGEYGKIDQSMWQNLWDNLTHGDKITIIFYANDTVGNIGWARVNLVKYTGEPFNFFDIITGPMGFYLTIISMGAMIPASTILVKTKYYKTLDKSKKSKVRKFLTLTFFTLALVILYYLL